MNTKCDYDLYDYLTTSWKTNLVSQIDIDGELRQIVSGIANYYKPEEMVGKHVLVVVNLKPVTLRGVESFGMILCEEKDGKLQVLEAKLDSGANIR